MHLNVKLFPLMISFSCINQGCQKASFSSNQATPASDEAIESVLFELSPLKSLSERLRAVGELIVDRHIPYDANSPLGEGFGYDADPRLRLDAFDCVTFVETAIAFSRATTVNEVRETMDAIRYFEAQPEFVRRNHFTDADWIPHNASAGYIQEITPDVAARSGFPTLQATATIDRQRWFETLHVPELPAFDASGILASEVVSLPYIALDALFGITPRQRAIYLAERLDYDRKIAAADETSKPALIAARSAHWDSFKDQFRTVLPGALDHIPDGSIVNTVRPNWDLTASTGTHMNISHQGLAVWKNGKLFYRNASSTAGFVVDVPFVDHLREQLPSPTIKGMNILRVINDHD